MQIHISRHLTYSPEDLLAMVVDVNAYPEFINFISSVRILSKKQISPHIEEMIADVVVQYKFFRETFRSKVIIDRENLQINIGKEGHGGAVRSLANIWDFRLLSDGSTQIDFDLEVSLKAVPLEFLLRNKLDKAAEIIMQAFENRAAQICKPVGDNNARAFV